MVLPSCWSPSARLKKIRQGARFPLGRTDHTDKPFTDDRSKLQTNRDWLKTDKFERETVDHVKGQTSGSDKLSLEQKKNDRKEILSLKKKKDRFADSKDTYWEDNKPEKKTAL